jgi:single-strand DNA-binding protein
MASFNRVILVGNLTRDPELRYIPSGMAVTDVGLAVNDRRKNAQGEWVEDTTFVDVTLWGRTAEVASEYLGKGSPLLIEGRLKLDTWEKDGKKQSKLRVVGERMQMLGAKGQGGSGGPNKGGAVRGGRDAGPPAEMEYSAAEASSYDSSSGDSGSGDSGGEPPAADLPF